MILLTQFLLVMSGMQHTLLLLLFTLLGFVVSCSTAGSDSFPVDSDSGVAEDTSVKLDGHVSDIEAGSHHQSSEGIYRLRPEGEATIEAEGGQIAESVGDKLRTEELLLVYTQEEIVISLPWGEAVLCEPSKEVATQPNAQHFECKQSTRVERWHDANFGRYSIDVSDVEVAADTVVSSGNLDVSFRVWLRGEIEQQQSDIGAYASFSHSYSGDAWSESAHARARIEAALDGAHPNEEGLLPWEAVRVEFSEPVQWLKPNYWEQSGQEGVFSAREVVSEFRAYSTGFDVAPEGWWSVDAVALSIEDGVVRTFSDSTVIHADEPSLAVRRLPIASAPMQDFVAPDEFILRGDAEHHEGEVTIGEHDALRLGEIIVPLKKLDAGQVTVRYSTWNSEPGIFGNPPPEVSVVALEGRPTSLTAMETVDVDDTWSEATYVLLEVIDDPVVWLRWHSESGSFSLCSLTIDSVRAE